MIRAPLSVRRALVDRWISSLRPLCTVINRRIDALGLGDPRVNVGPVYMDGYKFDDRQDRIRRGAVWFVDGVNTGFHVDFQSGKTVYEAWSGDRRVSIAVTGKTSEATLDRDLRAALLTAGLDHIAHLTAREHVLPVTRRSSAPLKK